MRHLFLAYLVLFRRTSVSGPSLGLSEQNAVDFLIRAHDDEVGSLISTGIVLTAYIQLCRKGESFDDAGTSSFLHVYPSRYWARILSALGYVPGYTGFLYQSCHRKCFLRWRMPHMAR